MGAREEIARHYSRGGSLADRILHLAREHRPHQGPLRAEDLSAFDQFHLGGRGSSEHLASLAKPAPGSLVLDIGAGIGGPARHLASLTNVTVVALDLTEGYCRDAAALSSAVGLQEQVLPCCGDATRLPFPDAAFDLVWTQHAAMNVPEKPALYREAARVLKPGGKLALHDIAAGAAGPPYYPTPWAGTADESFLLPLEEVRRLVLDTGLSEKVWEERTKAVLAQLRAEKQVQAAEAAPPAPGPHLLYPGFRDLARNLVQSLREDRARVILGLFSKPAA